MLKMIIVRAERWLDSFFKCFEGIKMESKILMGLLLALVLAVFLNALSFRYRMVELQRDGALSQAYIIDNWTGRMWRCYLEKCGRTIDVN